jgi:hypothetical protein
MAIWHRWIWKWAAAPYKKTRFPWETADQLLDLRVPYFQTNTKDEHQFLTKTKDEHNFLTKTKDELQFLTKNQGWTPFFEIEIVPNNQLNDNKAGHTGE